MTRKLFAFLVALDFALIVLSGHALAGARDRALVRDPDGNFDLPAGFTYKIVSRTGDQMSDGLRVPPDPDGMGAFPGPDGTTIVVCNHEEVFASDVAWLATCDSARIYDHGAAGLPPAGCTTTFVWDPDTQTVVRRYLSLAGTIANCSGGTTPWNSWLTCEEDTLVAGWEATKKSNLQRDHGYVFEVPARAGDLVAATPLRAMGRFTHEAVARDPRTGVIYQTEDVPDGVFYRFIPMSRNDLTQGGRLQAMVLRNRIRDTDNRAGDAARIDVGQRFAVNWIDLDDIEARTDALRRQGYRRGACRFDRAEGVCMMRGSVYFSCTSGGAAKLGQIWRYTPARREGRAAERRDPGTLELFYEVPDSALVRNPDNVCPMPDGSLLMCEDPEDHSNARLVVLTPEREVYTLARSRLAGELTGPAFSPDGKTLFVNMQKAGITIAVTGPWKR